MNGFLSNAHRFISPRPVFLIGTVSNNKHNIIPITNVTQISTEPSELIVSIYKEWETSSSLENLDHCTLSPLYEEYIEDGWKLGAKYSGWKYVEPEKKLESIETSIGIDNQTGLPYLQNKIPILFCKIIKKLDYSSDHNLFVLRPYKYISENGLEEHEVKNPDLNKIVFQVIQGVFGISIRKNKKLEYYK